VRVVDLGELADTGFGDEHRVARRPADDSFLRSNLVAADQSYLDEHRVELRSGEFETTSIRRQKKKKLSKKKRQQLKDAAEIQAAQERAIERSKTLAGADGAPAPRLESEQLQVSLRPLHATERNLRFEVRLVGQARLAPGEEPSPIDLGFVENLAWGETLELGLVELLRGGSPEEDYLVLVTPQP
jgi:hypothetical protein